MPGYEYRKFLLPEGTVEGLRSLLRGKDLLILGYSGSDDFDILPSIRLLNDSYARVIWVAHKETSKIVTRTFGRFCVVRGRTKEVLERLNLTSTYVPQSTSTPEVTSLGDFCTAWEREAHVTEHDKTLLVGTLFESAGLISNAIAVWERGLDDIFAWNQSTAVRYYFHLGDAYLREKSYVEAEQVFATAAERCQQLQDPAGWIRAQIGLAEVNWALGIVRCNKEGCDYAIKILEVLVETLPRHPSAIQNYDTLSVKARILMMHFTRQRKKLYDLRGMVFKLDDSMRSHSQLFTNDKILYSTWLNEFSLSLLTIGNWVQYERYRTELEDLYELLNVQLEHAVFLLESATLTASTRSDWAFKALIKAEQIFQSARSAVGVAATREGRAVLHLDVDDSKQLLIAAAKTYLTYECRAKFRCFLLLGAIAMLAGKPQAAKQYCDDAQSLASAIASYRLQREVDYYAAAILSPSDTIPDLMMDCWIHLRDPIIDNLGLSGWVMTHQECPDYFDNENFVLKIDRNAIRRR